MNPVFDPRKLSRIGRGPVGTAGVYFGRTGLELAVARSAAGQLNVVAQSHAPIEPTGDATEAKSRAQIAAATLRERVNPLEYRLVTAIGCEEVVCRTIRLPATDRGELEQMLELQIDNLTPLPLEEIVYSFEPLEVVDGQSLLLVAIARKDAVNARVEALETAGLPPQIVSVDALAIFRALMKRNLLPQDDRYNTLIIFGATGVNMVVHARGVQVGVRSLMITEESLRSAGGRNALREEWQRTLMSAQAEHPGPSVGGVTFVTWGETTRPLAQELAGEWDVPAESITNGAAPTPALSLCLEGESNRTPLNLLPDEWRERRHTARLRLQLVRAGIALAAVYVLALAVFVWRLEASRSRTNAIAREIKNRDGEYVKARQLRGELLAMQQQLEQKYSVLEVLREVAAGMPETMKLNYFVYKKDGQVTIRGQAPSSQAIFDFIGRVKKSDLFSEVKPISVPTGAGGLTRFEIVCTLKTAAGDAAGNS